MTPVCRLRRVAERVYVWDVNEPLCRRCSYPGNDHCPCCKACGPGFVCATDCDLADHDEDED